MFEAVLFDKDGTLIDFHTTWDAAVVAALRASAFGKAQLRLAADALHVDLSTETIRPSSPVIAESNDTVIELLGDFVDIECFGEVMLDVSVTQVVAAPGVDDALSALAGLGVPCAVVTNDWEDIAHSQLVMLGWGDRFQATVGSDSGFGAKPEPGMIIGAAGRLGVNPSRTVVVGDSVHDVDAGRSAGAATVLVTNGNAAGVAGERSDYVIAGMSELLGVLGLSE